MTLQAGLDLPLGRMMQPWSFLQLKDRVMSASQSVPAFLGGKGRHCLIVGVEVRFSCWSSWLLNVERERKTFYTLPQAAKYLEPALPADVVGLQPLSSLTIDHAVWGG